MNHNHLKDPQRVDMTDDELVDHLFEYHVPDEEQTLALVHVRAAMKTAARAVLKHAPKSADRTTALRALRDASMAANAAIVLRGVS